MKKFIERMIKIAKGEEVDDNIEYCVIDKNGRKIWADLIVSFLYEGDKATKAVVVAHDITQRKFMEEKLREREIWFRSLTELGASVYAVIEADGKVVYVSPPLERLFGWKHNDIVGKDIFNFLHPDDIAFAMDGKWLDHQIELFNKSYSSTQAQLIAWVRIPFLSTAFDSNMTMYYGNSTLTSSENPTGVWYSDYAGVWHLTEDPSGPFPQMKEVHGT